MRLQIVYLFILFFSYSSCDHIPSDVDIYVLDEESLQEDPSIDLNEITREIKYIRLDESENVIAENISNLINTQDYIILSTRSFNAIGNSNSELLLFNIEGEFVRKIGTQGSGPEEYLAIDDIELYDDTIYVLDRYSRAVLIFNLENRFIEKLTTPGVPCEFEIIENEIFFGYLFPELYDGFSLIQFNMKDERITNRILSRKGYNDSDLPSIGISLNVADNGLYFWESVMDTVYLHINGSTSPIITINYKNYPLESRDPSKNSFNSLMNHTFTQDLSINENYMYVNAIHPGDNKIESQYFFINLRTTQIFQASNPKNDYIFLNEWEGKILKHRFISFAEGNKMILQTFDPEDLNGGTIIGIVDLK